MSFVFILVVYFLLFGSSRFFTILRFTNETDNMNDGIKGGPLALFNKKGQALLFAPMDNYMAASVWHEGKPGGHLAWGIMGGVNEIPADFIFRTGMFYSDSINGVILRYDTI